MDQEHLVVRCLRCGTKNRIPRKRINDQPACGKCGAPLDEIIISCLQCGTKNRVPEERPHDRPLCGRCGAPLVVKAGTGKPVEVTDESFRREVLQNAGTVLVDFWAPWCAPCRMVAPIMDDLAARYAGAVTVAKLNVDENPLTATKYEVRSIPTILLFQDGILRDRMIGALPGEEIERRLNAFTKKN